MATTDLSDAQAQLALEHALKATLAEHGLRLTEVKWTKNLQKQTLGLALKVDGELNQQMALLA